MSAKNIWPIVLLLCAVMASTLFLGCAGCERLDQDQQGFKYSVTAGKPVSPELNPLLPLGWNWRWGIHTKIFKVSTLSNQYTFAESNQTESEFNEIATFDSSEGTTMGIDFTVNGGAIDLWKFYENYGRNQYTVPKLAKGITDPRIYEALREAGAYATVKLSELNQNVPAAQIRQNFVPLRDQLTKLTNKYMNQFGVEVKEVIPSGNFKYPSGNTIEHATNLLGDKNSEVEQKERVRDTAALQKEQLIAQAQIEADRIVDDASKEAERLITEAKAAAEEMRELVKELGPDKAIELLTTRELNELIRQGKISESYIIGDVLGKSTQ